jgi:hypothetical protein
VLEQGGLENISGGARRVETQHEAQRVAVEDLHPWRRIQLGIVTCISATISFFSFDENKRAKVSFFLFLMKIRYFL